jgi:hypothetical protein
MLGRLATYDLSNGLEILEDTRAGDVLDLDVAVGLLWGF